MELAIVKTRTKSDMHLLLELFKKIGASAKTLTVSEVEDMNLGFLIEKGRKSGYVDTETFLNKLKKK